MAHFRATIKGNRGEASRLGSAEVGLLTKVNGWDVGVRIEADTRGPDGGDRFSVYLTGGSNNAHPIRLQGYVMLVDGKPTWVACEDDDNA